MSILATSGCLLVGIVIGAAVVSVAPGAPPYEGDSHDNRMARRSRKHGDDGVSRQGVAQHEYLDAGPN
jgi:hypothetical protein